MYFCSTEKFELMDSVSVFNLKGGGSFLREGDGMINLINDINERGGGGIVYSSTGASCVGGR